MIPSKEVVSSLSQAPSPSCTRNRCRVWSSWSTASLPPHVVNLGSTATVEVAVRVDAVPREHLVLRGVHEGGVEGVQTNLRLHSSGRPSPCHVCLDGVL
eukprot:5019194-Pyramimonas_sp.AAC.1